MLRGDSVIDLAEHYLKRSLRNRTQIMTAQGVMTLTIPIRNANRPQQPMHSVEIDYSRRWQHQHWVAILSAYRSSPYFEHYAPYIEPLYQREWRRLIDFNEALMEVVTKLLLQSRRSTYKGVLLGAERSMSYVDTAQLSPDDTVRDLRSKGAFTALAEHTPRYMQVFEDRVPFEADMSILDLLFCEGANSLELLMESHR